MQRQLPAVEMTSPGRLARFRARLRAIMPRVAIAAAALFILRNLFANTFLFGSNPFGLFLRAITFIVVAFTICYYGIRALRWLKRKLLWRVRRRLVVTYLFVGLTPIILLGLLGVLSAFGGSSQGMARIMVAQLHETDRLALNAAKGLGTDFERLPAGVSDKDAQTWLDQRAALIRTMLPGARVALWRGAEGADKGTLGANTNAQLVSESPDPLTVGAGDDGTPIGAPLPGWLAGKTDWNGLAYIAPPGDAARFAAPSFRALLRGESNRRPFAVMVIVPISRALVQRYQDNTDLVLHPFFASRGLVVGHNSVSVDTGPGRMDGNANAEAAGSGQRREKLAGFKDQFDQPLSDEMYFVAHPSTDWVSGQTSPHLVFFFDWSWAILGKQFLGPSNFGGLWWTALKLVGLIFLVFELFALLAAAWMTRAVTGTVHKLHVATQFFKRGDFSYRVKVRSRDQLGELATAFNDMSASIEGLLHERVEREKLVREVEIAAEVQARLFPSTVPDLLTVEIAAECRAARGVAGDYYDYLEVAPGLAALALGDVSGKGISASLVMANLQASLRSQAAITSERLSMAERAVAVAANTTGDRVLARVVADADIEGAISRHATNVNRQLCASTEANRFATLFLSLYEDRTRQLRYTNAGHNPPILVRADGSTERLTVGGMMIGAFDFATYEEASIILGPDDMLVIFSDGISEAEHATTGEEFTEQRLLELCVAHRTMTAHDLRNQIFDEIDHWSGGQERGDDQTLLIVKGGVIL